MKVVGLITEYNPFHNGHKYHIEEAKRITNADYVIAVMSGNFVQRGAPAVIDKYSRANMALHNGVDLVLELPTCFATGSAEYFAHGAVSLLDKLDIVDVLCFGSECGDIQSLTQTAQFLLHTPSSYEKDLQYYLRQGLTYPAARLKAVQSSQKASEYLNQDTLTNVLSEPNNILGIEYIKALIHLDSKIKPATIQRISAHYHDSELVTKQANNTKQPISSATAIRKAIQLKTNTTFDSFEQMKQSVPADVYQVLEDNFNKTYPITEEDFSFLLKYKLLSEDSNSLKKYMDITGDLADRMKNTNDLNKSISELVQELKTKNVTLTRINRALIHLLLNITTANVEEYKAYGYASYARVLGIKKEASHLLRQIEKSGRVPIITKVSKANKQLDPLAMRMLKEDIFAAHLYNQTVYEKYNTVISNEYKHGICML